MLLIILHLKMRVKLKIKKLLINHKVLMKIC